MEDSFIAEINYPKVVLVDKYINRHKMKIDNISSYTRLNTEMIETLAYKVDPNIW